MVTYAYLVYLVSILSVFVILDGQIGDLLKGGSGTGLSFSYCNDKLYYETLSLIRRQNIR